MSRTATGWRLARASWAVLRADSSLAIFAVLAIVAASVACEVIIAIGVAVADGVNVPWLALPFILAGVYAAIYYIAYFKVALAGAARLSMDGRDTTLRDGVAVARRHRGVIARWALLEFGLGLLLSIVGSILGGGRDGGVAGNVLAATAGAAWSVASFFVIPLLALEGLRPRAALSRSVTLVRGHWGEAISGRTGIGLAIFLVSVLPITGLFLGADQLKHVSAGAQTAGDLVAALFLVAAIALASLLGVIFRVELYRYATEGTLTGSFAKADVDAAFGR